MFSLDNMLPRQTTKVDLFVGRLQPIHNLHAKIIHSMRQGGIVAIVKGAKTTLDAARNPLDFETQKRLVHKVAPNSEVMKVSNGYLPEIVNSIRAEGKEVTAVYAGTDRIKGYKAQIERANKGLSKDKQIKVTFKETEREEDTPSATAVREAIRKNDRKGFEKNVPQAIWGEFDILHKLMKETLMENMKDIQVKKFEDWLNEESNVTAGVEMPEVKPTKKKEDEEK